MPDCFRFLFVCFPVLCVYRAYNLKDNYVFFFFFFFEYEKSMAVYESSNGSEECLSTLILFPMKIGHPAHVRIQVDTRHQENRHTKKKCFFLCGL